MPEEKKVAIRATSLLIATAHRLQNLSYREMQDFASLLAPKIVPEVPATTATHFVVEGLLKAADEVIQAGKNQDALEKLEAQRKERYGR